jgi:putative phage-type endonuclease
MSNDARAKWLAARRGFVCGSDIAAIMGLDAWGKTAYDVWCEKMGLIADNEPTQRQAIGNYMEMAIAAWYQDDTQMRVHRKPFDLRVGALGFVAASIDGIVEDTRTPEPTFFGFEAKHVGAFAQWWGDQSSVPLHVEMQCQWYMMVTGMQRWDVAALFGDHTFCRYEMSEDFWMQFAMLVAADTFWREHVVADVSPNATTPANALDSIKRIPRTGVVRWCNADEEDIAMQYFSAMQQLDFAKAALSEVRARVITMIGGDDGVEGPTWKITHTCNINGVYTLRTSK